MTTRHDMSWYHWRDATEFERFKVNIPHSILAMRARKRESDIGCCCLPVAQPPFDWRYEYDCLRHMIVDLCPEYLSHERIDKRRLTVDVATKTLIRQLIGLGYGHSELAIVKRALAAMEFQEIVTIGLDTVRGAPPIVGGSVTHSHFQQQGQPR